MSAVAGGSICGRSIRLRDQSVRRRRYVRRERHDILRHPVFLKAKVGGLESGDVVALVVGHDYRDHNLPDIHSNHGRVGRLSRRAHTNPKKKDPAETAHRHTLLPSHKRDPINLFLKVTVDAADRCV
jgi:hypothetical protein